MTYVGCTTLLVLVQDQQSKMVSVKGRHNYIDIDIDRYICFLFLDGLFLSVCLGERPRVAYAQCMTLTVVPVPAVKRWNLWMGLGDTINNARYKYPFI